MRSGPLEPDPAQARVLEHADGGLLVTGPPGAGKTALLVERFARLVEGGEDPERVALFTLHRRATRDARDRLLHRLGRSLPDLPVFTVHGFAFRVLGLRFGEVGYDQPPQVLSAPEQYTWVGQMLREESPREWPRFGRLLTVRGFAQEVADFVLRAQERLLSPEELDGLVERSGGDGHAEVARFYRRYLDGIAAAGKVDFAGLLAQTAELLARDVSPAEAYRHVGVDDYQDATPATESILRALAPASRSLVVAADPGGHVFSYRGGTLAPLGRVGDALGCRQAVALERSYRPAGASLATLEDPAAAPGTPPPGMEAREFPHPGEEADAVAAELLRLRVEDDVPWEGMAVVLRRYGEYLTALRHALSRHRIPFVVVAQASAVASEPANRPVIDLLRYVFRPERRAELVDSVLTSPVGGLDPHQLRRLRREARLKGTSLHELAGSGEVPTELREPVERFRRVLAELPAVADHEGLDGALFWLWSELPHFRDLVAESRDRDIDAVAALGDVLARFVERRPGATVVDYLDTVEAAEFGPDPWVAPEERNPHAVRVISAHLAHGAEFEVVLVAGCLEGEFPSLHRGSPLLDLEALVSSPTPTQRLGERLAEERALFRLAVSRARRRTVLFASRSTSSRNPRTPSRFAARLGLAWAGAGEAPLPAASPRQVEALLRRRLADPGAGRVPRLAALAALPAIGARPAEWWWGRDWTDPGAPMYPGEIHTSYSRLSALENCALQYLYAAELGLDTERSHSMWLGSLVHDIIDRIQRGDLERTEEAAFAALDEGWRRDVFANRALERQRHRDARRMLQRWLGDESLNGLELVASEQAFSFPLDGAVIRGRIDAVFRRGNGRLQVVDYKTSRVAIGREEAKRSLQLAAYYLALRRVPELRELGDPEVLALVFLGAEAYGTFKSREHSPRPGYEEWAEETIKGLLGEVRAERFAPSPEADCQWCRFKTICPMWPEGDEVKA
ncbi:MAG: PD-(D/E)XK nuclease family protein [Actinomycetota bacterium]